MFEPMPLYKRFNYNTNNFHKYAPFNFENNNILIQPSFYNKIKGTYVETELLKYFDKIILKDDVMFGNMPEEDKISEDLYDKFFKVYKIHLRWYDADKWYHILDRPSVIVKYDNMEKEILKNISKRMICGGSQKMNSEEISSLKNLIDKLDEGINNCKSEDGCFAKLSGASTKHDYAPYPITSGIDCLNHLLPSKRIFRNIDCCHIFLQPWNPNVNLKSELRIFVEDNKIIGVSQQALDIIYQEFISVYGVIYKEIIKMAQDLWDSIKDKLPYTEATIDAWLDENNTLQLIEINTYGIWTAAGSSWFEWETDFPKPNNIKSLDDVPFRLTYPNTYWGIPNSYRD